MAGSDDRASATRTPAANATSTHGAPSWARPIPTSPPLPSLNERHHDAEGEAEQHRADRGPCDEARRWRPRPRCGSGRERWWPWVHRADRAVPRHRLSGHSASAVRPMPCETPIGTLDPVADERDDAPDVGTWPMAASALGVAGLLLVDLAVSRIYFGVNPPALVAGVAVGVCLLLAAGYLFPAALLAAAASLFITLGRVPGRPADHPARAARPRRVARPGRERRPPAARVLVPPLPRPRAGGGRGERPDRRGARDRQGALHDRLRAAHDGRVRARPRRRRRGRPLPPVDRRGPAAATSTACARTSGWRSPASCTTSWRTTSPGSSCRPRPPRRCGRISRTRPGRRSSRSRPPAGRRSVRCAGWSAPSAAGRTARWRRRPRSMTSDPSPPAAPRSASRSGCTSTAR